ncbi:MAG: heavy-metal-associated domain-containing protein [Bacteroidales bacterium]|jgi:copper chaperone CopZ|nr:heavy-metal-associated domain-containing protein [Bacteroidales bacterium]
MKTTIEIENLKCHGCANTIKKSISAMDDVADVQVNHESSEVIIFYTGQTDRTEEFAQKLKMLGYPRAGENSAGRVVKSYISCAIGRMDSEKTN